MGIYNHQKKKGVKVKTKPKDYSKYLDFANETESQIIDVPSLQSSSNAQISPKISNLINYSVTWNDAPPPSNNTVHLFVKKSYLSSLSIVYRCSDYVDTAVNFYIYILRNGVNIMSWYFSYVGNNELNTTVIYDKDFNNFVVDGGDILMWDWSYSAFNVGIQSNLKIYGIYSE